MRPWARRRFDEVRDPSQAWLRASGPEPTECSHIEAGSTTRRVGAGWGELVGLGRREVTIMRAQDPRDPLIIDGLVLMRAFLKIADAADRRKVIELAAALARSASPPIASR
jgi:hypothetical protein